MKSKFSKFKSLSLQHTVELGDYITKVSCRESSDVFYVASADGELAAFTLTTGKGIWREKKHTGCIQSLVITNPYSLIASGGEDGMLILTDFISGKTEHVRNMRSELKKNSWVGHLAWSKVQDTLAVACGREVTFLQSNLCSIGSVRTAPGTINGMGWSNSGQHLATVSFGGGTLWSPTLENSIAEWKDNVAMIEMAWSPNEMYIACGCQDSAMLIWDLKTKQNLKMSGYPAKVTSLAWDHAGRFLVTAGHSSLFIWDFKGAGPSGREPLSRELHQAAITSMLFNHKGTLLCSGDEDGTLLVWKSGTFVPTMFGVASSPVSAISWSSSGKSIISGHQDGSIRIWGVA